MAIPRLAEREPAEPPRDEAPWVPIPRAGTGRTLALIAIVYVLSSLVAGPVFPGQPSSVAHWKLGPIYLGRPIFLLHSSYGGWRAGSGVSARYLVPMLPVLAIAVARARPRGRLPALLLAYSGVVCGLAGVLPVAAYDKTPWGMLAFLWQRLGLILP